MCEKSPGYKATARIDLHVEVPVVPFCQLADMAPGEQSATIRERVVPSDFCCT